MVTQLDWGTIQIVVIVMQLFAKKTHTHRWSWVCLVEEKDEVTERLMEDESWVLLGWFSSNWLSLPKSRANVVGGVRGALATGWGLALRGLWRER
jgi:hypothetical protein